MTFNVRCKEHIYAVRTNNSNSGYSNHILATGHTYGTIKDNYRSHKDRKEGWTFKYIRKISHLQN
jgi:hypothetical protein